MNFDSKQKFSIRKYSIGVASVLLGTFLMGVGLPTDDVHADEVSGDSLEAAANESTSDLLVSNQITGKETVESSKDMSTEAVQNVDMSSASESKSADVNLVDTIEKPSNSNNQFEEKQVSSVVETKSNNSEVSPELKTVVNEDNGQSSRSTESTSSPAYVNTSFRSAGQVTSRVVSNWSGFVSALQDSNVQNITISGNIIASGDNGNSDNGRTGSVDRSINISSRARALTIQGRNQLASLDLLSNTLKLTGDAWSLAFKNLQLATANSKGVVDLTETSGQNTITFENVTTKGTLYGGGGNTDVVVKGVTSSTVSDSYLSINGQTQYVQRNVGAAGHSQQRREANIHDAKSVTVAQGANLTLNRSSQGDAINLSGGSTVRVSDNGSLTINMNTSNGTESARYHNAGIFMENGGNVVTGNGSKLVLNTSIGQAISLGMKRPSDGITHLDRWGGYGTVNAFKKNSPSNLKIGDNAIFEVNGRDGLIFGNNSSFSSGVNSKVRFENKGRGVAIDFGDNSHVVFGKNSTNTFHSVGKGPRSGGGPSGSYNAYNYIGVNENGTITVDEYATFRVQMDDRGDNAWDDVINLDSKSGRKERPLFQANKGSIVDIRDDNTNYYAELISVPLGNSTNTVFQFNNPLYVSFMRYTNSKGLSAGEITGKLPIITPQGNNPEQIGHGNILYVSNGSRHSGNHIEFNGPNGTRVNPSAGTYTVYSMNRDGRDVKSRDKQSSVWTDIEGGAMSIAGFQPGGNPEINPSLSTSVRTKSSTGGVIATDKTYGIDPVIANRQNIWVSNGTSINPTANHKNVIRYVYEDGTPVLDENGKAKVVVQSSDWNRILEVAIDQNHFKNILKNSSVENGDEFLAAYGKAEYIVRDVDGDGISDTGWTLTGTTNSKATYDTVVSPNVDGYKAEILTSNVPGLSRGSDASRVTVTFNPSEIKDDIVVTQNGRRTVSETYWRNIVDKVQLQNYETVVVYKLDKQKANVKYVNISHVEKPVLANDKMEGRGGEPIAYSTTNRINDFLKQGYELVSDGFSSASDKNYDTNSNVDQEFTVELKERIIPVGPHDPRPVPGVPVTPTDPAPWPKGSDKLEDQIRVATQVIRYRTEENGKEVFKSVHRKVTFARVAHINLVTGHINYLPWYVESSVNDDSLTPVVESSVTPRARLARTTSDVNLSRREDNVQAVSSSNHESNGSVNNITVSSASNDVSTHRKPNFRLVARADDIRTASTRSGVMPFFGSRSSTEKPHLVRGASARRSARR